MKKLIVIMLILAPVTLQAEYFSDFSRQDWILQGVFTGLVYVDYRQTVDFIDYKKTTESECCIRTVEYKETNFILGENPTRNEVNALIFIGLLSHTIALWAIPSEYRVYWQSISITMEINAVSANHRNGFKVQYYF